MVGLPFGAASAAAQETAARSGGRLTAADISIVYMLYLIKVMRQFDGAPENVQAYFKRLTKRESWVAATAVE